MRFSVGVERCWLGFDAQTKAEALQTPAFKLIPFFQLLFYDANLCIDCCNRHGFYFCNFPCLWFYEIDQSAQVSPSGFQVF